MLNTYFASVADMSSMRLCYVKNARVGLLVFFIDISMLTWHFYIIC